MRAFRHKVPTCVLLATQCLAGKFRLETPCGEFRASLESIADPSPTKDPTQFVSHEGSVYTFKQSAKLQTDHTPSAITVLPFKSYTLPKEGGGKPGAMSLWCFRRASPGEVVNGMGRRRRIQW